MSKKKVTIICGGQSVEHAISICSARFIASCFRPMDYEVNVMLITESGHWLLLNNTDEFIHQNVEQLLNFQHYQRVMPAIGSDDATWISLDGQNRWQSDVVFPIIHGSLGEDGCLQGLLRFLNVPFVGSDVLSSALCMDKWAARQILSAKGIAMTPWFGLVKHQWQKLNIHSLIKEFSYPLFVKPADLGSSVGISQVKTPKALEPAIEHAFSFSRRVLIEQGVINGRELECGVIGSNENPKALSPAELFFPHAEFYDYHAKYIDPDGMHFHLPAKLPQWLFDHVQKMAVAAYQALHCEGLARVDFFITSEEKILFSEINTLPGCTQISMVPHMLKQAGIDRFDFMDQLMAQALLRAKECQTCCYQLPEPSSSRL